MPTELRRTGIDAVGDVPWGTHFCHFYETKDDLLDVLIPYFRAGLEQDEVCLWVVFDPLDQDDVRNALREAGPWGERHLASGDITIVPASQWCRQDGTLDVARAIDTCRGTLARALARGRSGMRANGNEAWLMRRDGGGLRGIRERPDRVDRGRTGDRAVYVPPGVEWCRRRLRRGPDA